MEASHGLIKDKTGLPTSNFCHTNPKNFLKIQTSIKVYFSKLGASNLAILLFLIYHFNIWRLFFVSLPFLMIDKVTWHFHAKSLLGQTLVLRPFLWGAGAQMREEEGFIFTIVILSMLSWYQLEAFSAFLRSNDNICEILSCCVSVVVLRVHRKAQINFVGQVVLEDVPKKWDLTSILVCILCLPLPKNLFVIPFQFCFVGWRDTSVEDWRCFPQNHRLFTC